MKRLVSLISAVLIALPAFAVELPPPIPGKHFSPRQERLAAVSAKRTRKVEAQHLPGLGSMPGDSAVFRTNVVRVSTDRTEVINVSASLPNRIATPFANPQSIDNQTDDFEVQAVGQSLYVTMKSGKAVALYVTGDKPNDPVISLTLVPKNLPAQTVTLQLDKPLAGTNASGSDGGDQPPDSNVYTDQIRYNLRQIALNKTPEGFSEGYLPKSVARMGKVNAYPLTRYSGPNYDIYHYRLEALVNNVELEEGAFYSEGVRAVAFFPNALLQKGETTEVYVVSDKVETN